MSNEDLVYLDLDFVMREWAPGSYDEADDGSPWTWEHEETDILTHVCQCCGKEGHYQIAMEEFIRGNGDPPGGVLLGDDGRIWDGHHTIVALKRLGRKMAPVIFDSPGFID